MAGQRTSHLQTLVMFLVHCLSWNCCYKDGSQEQFTGRSYQMTRLRNFRKRGTNSWRMGRSRHVHAIHAPIKVKGTSVIYWMTILQVRRSTKALKLSWTRMMRWKIHTRVLSFLLTTILQTVHQPHQPLCTHTKIPLQLATRRQIHTRVLSFLLMTTLQTVH